MDGVKKQAVLEDRFGMGPHVCVSLNIILMEVFALCV